jgi:hypothetical protein
MSNAAKVIQVARKEVGYNEGRSNGHWNNRQHYSPAVPGLEWSNYQPWCATFVAWCAMKAGVADLYPRTASCDVGGNWFKARKRWSAYPAIGAQVFYGHSYDLNHTGIVYDYDGTYVYTIEGNTNNSGSREGDGVYLRKRRRRDANVIGYGYPEFPEGIKSADPKWKHAAPKDDGGNATPVADTKPKRTPFWKLPRSKPKNYFLGARGRHVTWLGKRLVAHGFGKHYSEGPGPLFTRVDKANVRDFQLAQGWRGRDADGFPGPETLKRLRRKPARKV